MTATQLSPETAPRDLEALKQVGRFNLRALATQLKHFEGNEANKQAFMNATNDQQAETIFKLLQELDGGGKAKPASRTPSTKNAGAAKPNGTSAAAKTPPSEPAGNTGGSVGGGAEKILAAISSLNAKYDGIKESLDNLSAIVGQLQGVSAGTNRFVALSIGLSMKLAEETLGAGPEQILETVLEDMPMVEAAMRKMAPASEEGDEEGGEEGNDEE